MKAPFPWFGGKSRAAGLIWERMGDPPNFVEPFFGSGAVLLNRPTKAGTETVNDIDGFVCNAWRSIARDPEKTAEHADYPVNENDLHARHAWLKVRREDLSRRLEGDPEFYDAKIAGWWLWGMACWIGGGFCGEGPQHNGPWHVVYGQLVHLRNSGMGVTRQSVHLGNSGMGVTRKSVHLGDSGKGVTRQSVHLGDSGRGVQRNNSGLLNWFLALQQRLRRVRVCCGDFERVLGPAVTTNHGVTGVVLDPPYGSDAGRDMDIYAKDCGAVAKRAYAWAVANGSNPMLRIAFCGYDGEHAFPSGWCCEHWKASGGYGAQGREDSNGKTNRHRERIWFSPHCLQPGLFDTKSPDKKAEVMG